MHRPLVQAGFAAGAVVLIFFLHSCIAGPAVRPGARGRGPGRLAVLLSDFREPTRFSAEGEIRVEGRGGVLWTTGRTGETASLELRVTGTGLEIPPSRWEGDRFLLTPVAGKFRIEGRDREGKEIRRRYRGSLALVRAESGWQCVNEVELEDYLLGVVGREMSPLRFPLEALKAQAVAARTYAWHEWERSLRRAGGTAYDLFDDERSQAYGGLDAESGAVEQAVAATCGMVLTWEGGLLPAYYSSTCGGRTQPAWDALPVSRKSRPLAGTECGYCSDSPFSEWRATFSKRQLAEILGFARPVQRVEVTERNSAGRAVRVCVFAEGAPSRTLEANAEFRRKLGPRKVKSTWFEIRDAGDSIELTGRGWGHGAGMCQYGAGGMAREGFRGIEILEHYFPGACVEKRY